MKRIFYFMAPLMVLLFSVQPGWAQQKSLEDWAKNVKVQSKKEGTSYQFPKGMPQSERDLLDFAKNVFESIGLVRNFTPSTDMGVYFMSSFSALPTEVVPADQKKSFVNAVNNAISHYVPYGFDSNGKVRSEYSAHISEIVLSTYNRYILSGRSLGAFTGYFFYPPFVDQVSPGNPSSMVFFHKISLVEVSAKSKVRLDAFTKDFFGGKIKDGATKVGLFQRNGTTNYGADYLGQALLWEDASFRSYEALVQNARLKKKNLGGESYSTIVREQMTLQSKITRHVWELRAGKLKPRTVRFFIEGEEVSQDEYSEFMGDAYSVMNHESYFFNLFLKKFVGRLFDYMNTKGTYPTEALIEQFLAESEKDLPGGGDPSYRVVNKICWEFFQPFFKGKSKKLVEAIYASAIQTKEGRQIRSERTADYLFSQFFGGDDLRTFQGRFKAAVSASSFSVR